jgi:hypothetical protein
LWGEGLRDSEAGDLFGCLRRCERGVRTSFVSLSFCGESVGTGIATSSVGRTGTRSSSSVPVSLAFIAFLASTSVFVVDCVAFVAIASLVFVVLVTCAVVSACDAKSANCNPACVAS